MLLTLILLLALTHGQSAQVRSEDVLILSDGKFPPPPCPRCMRADIRETRMPAQRRAKALILSGHSAYPGYLGLGTEEMARTIARLVVAEPVFFIADTCYGAQAELLLALAKHGVRPQLTVAATEPVSFQGLIYGALFDGGSISLGSIPREVKIRGTEAASEPIGLTFVTSAALDRLDAVVAVAHDLRTDACAQAEDLIRKHPNLLPVPVAGARGDLLVAIPKERFTGCHVAPSSLAAPSHGVVSALLALLLFFTLLAHRSSPCSHIR